MVFGDAAGAVSQLIQEHRYRPRTSHGVSLRPRRTRVKRSLGQDHELSYASTRRDFALRHMRFDERGGRATFDAIGIEHSPTSATGTGWERTPWHANSAGGVEDDAGAPRVRLARLAALMVKDLHTPVDNCLTRRRGPLG